MDSRSEVIIGKLWIRQAVGRQLLDEVLVAESDEVLPGGGEAVKRVAAVLLVLPDKEYFAPLAKLRSMIE